MSKNENDRMTPLQHIQQILANNDIRIEHSDACVQEANDWLANPGIDDPDLQDLSSLPFITIDNEDSRDLDQALLIEAVDDADASADADVDRHAAGYRVRYALADAAYYVRAGSALFREALSRGVTYYTPALAVPMLPESLSEGLISLNEGVVRRALVFDMLLDQHATIMSTTIVRARIRSHAKLSYNGVQEFLDAQNSDSPHAYTQAAFASSLKLLQQLGLLLMQRALDRDVVPFIRSEAQIVVTSDNRFEMQQRKRADTERYNEQISLLCNMQGAQLLTSLLPDNSELQAIFRVHEAPLRGRITALRTLINDFAEHIGGSDAWRWEAEQSLADYVMQLPEEEALQGQVRAIERQILVSNQASQFNSEPGRHHALGAASYARFSSPMREIVGIFTHKELLEALGSTDIETVPAGVDDQHIREQVIAIANQAKQTQKRIDKAIEFIALQDFLSRDLELPDAPIRQGTIMGFRKERMYIACDAIGVDLKVLRSDIEAQYPSAYTFSDLFATPDNSDCPRWQLGQRVGIKTSSYDPGDRHFRLQMFAD